MALQIGQQLGNYRLIRLLGHGGFADVYLGEHVHLKTQAAIKVLHTQLEPENVETFRNEALTIAHLTHPHIIRVLDFEVENSVPFLIMDYAPNGTLRTRHPKGTPLPSTVFLPYVRQIASALQYAHDQKLIHRDVKPENMLLGRNNEVLLSDFGIALIAQNSLSQSTEEMITGTMSYMAPEQIQGKPRPASDQYSLAVVVYEWLSGIRPFSGSYMEIVTQHLSTAPPPLHERVQAIPYAVEQVVLKALAKDPHQRFSRVQDFAAALEQAYQTPRAMVGQVAPRPASPPLVLAPQKTMAQEWPLAQTVQQPPSTPHTSYRETPFPAQESSSALVKKSARKVGKGLKRALIALLIVIVVVAIAICGLGYGVFHYFTSPSAAVDTSGATALAGDFIQAISIGNYDQAYNDFGSQLTSQTPRNQFIQLSRSEDTCYGPISSHKSTATTSQGSKVNYIYLMTRQRLPKPYHLYFTLQINSAGTWQVIDYHSDLSPPACRQ